MEEKYTTADMLIVLEIIGGHFINEANEKLEDENISDRERRNVTNLKLYLESVTDILKTLNEAYVKVAKNPDLANKKIKEQELPSSEETLMGHFKPEIDPNC